MSGGTVWQGLAAILPIFHETVLELNRCAASDTDCLTGLDSTIHQPACEARYGAYRPFVFLTTGLELGMWMTAVSLTAVWIWRCGALKQIGALSFGSLVLPALLVVTVLCRSGGALILLLGGLFVLWSCTRFNSKLPFYALLLIAPAYYQRLCHRGNSRSLAG